jgi:hypothetical protein
LDQKQKAFMTRVRKYKRPEMWDMGVVHSSIMKKVDWSSSEKEELVLVGVKRFLGAGRSRFQPPTHVQTVVETTNQKKKRKKNLLLGFPSSTGELQEHGGGDGTSRVLSGAQLVAAPAAADHHHQAATLVNLAVQNGVMDVRIGRSTGPAAAAFVALDQAEEEEEEDKSALKYPSALAAHVCGSPVDVDQELAAAASKHEETITRHYLGSLGITKTGACSNSSQLRAAAAAGEEEDNEEASYQEGKANPSPFLQLQQQQQEVVAGMSAKSLLLAAADATTKTTTTTGSAEVHSDMFKPIRSSNSYIQ